MNIIEAIKCWNDPNCRFASSFISYKGHQRGKEPHFNWEFKEGMMHVNITQNDFLIDKFSIDDFDSEEEKEDFINLVSGEIEAIDNAVNELTKEINKRILEGLRKKRKRWR